MENASRWRVHALGLGAGLSLLTGVVHAGAAVVRALGEPWNTDERALQSGVAAGALVLGAGLASAWHRRAMREERLAFVMIVVLGLFTLVACDLAAWVVIPAWPARVLHGVPPLAMAGHNDWGQRDSARTLAPAEGVLRVALVGDSFLEEGEGEPLGARLERRVAPAGMEVVNLGVSATAPDEYFHRVRRVALPLGARHVVVFFYAGNDFVMHTTLHDWWGILATAPRDSLAQAVGLGPLEHLFMNRLRPWVRAWGAAGELARMEQDIAREISTRDDTALREWLVNRAPPAARDVVRTRLADPGSATVLEMLRHPDAGRLRSYHLGHALEASAVAPLVPDDPTVPLQWLSRAHESCSAAGARFTLVVIPEAFSVDDRMAERWSPLADLRARFAGRRVAAAALVDRARAGGLDVVDLHPVLQGVRGSYLDMDGHFSAAGAERVADALAAHLRK